LLTTTTGTNGPPLALYLLSQDAPARAARATLAVLSVSLAIVGLALIALRTSGHPDPYVLLALPLMWPASLVARRIAAAMNQQVSEWLTTMVLVTGALAAGASGLGL
jgi:uncharacterized membrane protein YfcA